MDHNPELQHLLNKSANLLTQAAQTFARMAELLETSNQPLPEPQRAPLVGDDDSIMPTYGTDRREPAAATIATSADLRPDTDVVWTDESGRLIHDTAGLRVVGGMVVREPPKSEAKPVVDHPTPTPAVESVEEPDNKMTASQWGTSKHFLQFMKQDDFKGWSVEEQNARRDQFVEHVNKTTPGKKMGRWGQQFKMFHNLKEKK